MEGRDWRFRVLGFAVLLLAGRPAHPADPPPLLCPGRLAWWSDLPIVTWTPQRSDPSAVPSARDGPQITPGL